MTDGEITAAYVTEKWEGTVAYFLGGHSDGKAIRIPAKSAEAGYINSVANISDIYVLPGQEPTEPPAGAWGKYVRTGNVMEVWEWKELS